jgi:acyl-CoA synthetase (AMP-forming)/AMP-acid ligase II
VVAAHAVWRAGGIVVTVNPLFTVGEMRTELLDAGAGTLLAALEVMQRCTEAAGLVGITRLLELDQLPRGAAPPIPKVRADDTALILYSSGTTGLPKGVELTHRNLIASVFQLRWGDLARDDDVLLALSPFFHFVGLHGVMNLGMFAGAAIVIFARYDFPKLLGAIQRYRISSVFLTPPVVTDLAKHPDVERFDLSSLRSILCAAAPLGAEIEQMTADRLGCVVRQGYGMTETSGPVSTNLAEHGLVRRRGSAGQLAPSTESKIVSLADGSEVIPGSAETGEILVRGPQVMKGYLNNPQATAISLEPDGWLHTGDVGYADAEGYLFIVDRVKEIIKYKAYQVAPAELEAVLATHPAVLDAAVVPVPDAESGEIPKALVVLRGAVSAEQLMAYVAERVAPYKKIRQLEFVDSIPKSASGKILRRVLVERERAAQQR